MQFKVHYCSLIWDYIAGKFCNEYYKAHSYTHRKWFSLFSKRSCCTIKLNAPFACISSNILLTHTFLFQTSFVVLSHLDLLLFSIKNKNTKSFLLLISYSIFLFSSIICVFVLWIWCGDELFFKCKHLAQNWDELKATNRRRIYRPKWESSLKEYPSKTLNIFWKSPYKKN